MQDIPLMQIHAITKMFMTKRKTMCDRAWANISLLLYLAYRSYASLGIHHDYESIDSFNALTSASDLIPDIRPAESGIL